MGAEGPGAGEPFAPGDLARLRAIAEEGRRRPLLGGPALVAWGSAIAAAALFTWSVLARVITLPGWAISLTWFVLMGGAAVLSGRWQRREVTSDAALSVANRVSRLVWQMAGAFLGTLSIGLTIHAAYLTRAGGDAPWAMLSVMAPVTFGVFGIALAATAVAGDARWLLRYAWGSLALTVVTAVLLGQMWQHLVMAAGAVLVGVLPGLKLLRDRRDG